MQTTTTENITEILAYVRSPPATLDIQLQRFYRQFDGVEVAIGEWYSPRIELPHLLMLDLCLNRVDSDYQRWVDQRVPTLSIAQHIIINEHQAPWNPLEENFTVFLQRSNGITRAIRKNNGLVESLWQSMRSNTCCHHS